MVVVNAASTRSTAGFAAEIVNDDRPRVFRPNAATSGSHRSAGNGQQVVVDVAAAKVQPQLVGRADS
jgi:hypothetical protein